MTGSRTDTPSRREVLAQGAALAAGAALPAAAAFPAPRFDGAALLLPGGAALLVAMAPAPRTEMREGAPGAASGGDI